MIGTITPLVQAASARTRLLALSAYTLGSLSASVSVGAVLGLAGSVLSVPPLVGVVILSIGAATLAALELAGVAEWFHPVHRQTRKQWYIRFGLTRAAFLWGIDLGLGVTTRVYFLSFWLTMGAALVLGSPLVGAVLLGAYGLGRALLVLTGPFLANRATVLEITPQLIQSRGDWHRVHAILLAICAVALALVAVRPGSVLP